MKKFTIIMIALLVASMSFAQNKSVNDLKSRAPFKFTTAQPANNYTKVRAQRDGEATIILTVGDVWGDGTGYQMLLDADATAYGTTIPENGGLTSSGNADASVYAEFEYKLPENADGAMATTNILLNSSATVNIPAGTYDWCITNPTPGDRIWIASANGSIPGRYDDYEFEAGKIYTFTVSYGGQNDQVDLTIEDVPSDPTIIANVTELSFVAEINTESEATSVVITALNLTQGITATVAAPFEVSADNTTFGTTANLTADGGTFFVRFAPTTAGTQTGTMTISSTGAESLNIALTGAGYDCDAAIQAPWTEDFESTSMTIYCWSIYDANQDNNTFTYYVVDDEGNHAFGIKYTSVQNDDYLISPYLLIGHNATISFDVAHASDTYPESYEVYAVVGDNMVLIRNEATTGSQAPAFETITVDLATYEGQTIRIAIKNTSNNMYYFFVDNFTLTGTVGVDENIADAIAVYPNPTNDIVTIANAEGKDIVIVNSLGQVVANIQNAAANQTIDVANFANGTYFVKVDAEVVKLNVVR